MKKILTLCMVFSLTGCAGLAVGTFGTFESKKDSFSISEKRNKFSFELSEEQPTRDVLVSAWGAPDEVVKEGNCDVLIYYDGYSWSGFGAFVLLFPVPLLVPSGHDENRFYFIDGNPVGLIKEYGDVTGALGFMCGSNECKGMAGPVNTDKARTVDASWCD